MSKIVVGKGKSVPVGGPEGEWLKVFYQVEALLDEGENPVMARQGVEHMIDEWLQGEPAGPEAIIPAEADLERCPWTPYQEGHRAAWIKNPAYFANFDDPIAEELSKAIKQADGKLEHGEYVYYFSGNEKQFIARKPVKKSNQEDPHENIKEGAERTGLRKW